MSDEKNAWKLPAKPEEPEKPKTIRIVIPYPRPPVLGNLRPCEALVWDVLSRGSDEAVDVEPGQFLGLGAEVLFEVLDNLCGLRLLSGEGISPAQHRFQFSQDIQRMGAVREAQDAAAKRAKEAAQKQAATEPREPRGFALPPVSPRIES